MSEFEDFGGPINRPAQNARQVTPGQVHEGAQGFGDGAGDFLGLNQALQPEPAPQASAQPQSFAPTQADRSQEPSDSWLLGLPNEPQPRPRAPAVPVAEEQPSPLLNTAWREERAVRKPRRWIAPLVGGATLAAVAVVGYPRLQRDEQPAPAPERPPEVATAPFAPREEAEALTVLARTPLEPALESSEPDAAEPQFAAAPDPYATASEPERHAVWSSASNSREELTSAPRTALEEEGLVEVVDPGSVIRGECEEPSWWTPPASPSFEQLEGELLAAANALEEPHALVERVVVADEAEASPIEVAAEESAPEPEPVVAIEPQPESQPEPAAVAALEPAAETAAVAPASAQPAALPALPLVPQPDGFIGAPAPELAEPADAATVGPRIPPEALSASQASAPVEPAKSSGNPRSTRLDVQDVMLLGRAGHSARSATATELKGVWKESSIPLQAIANPTKLLTPAVGQVRAVLDSGDLFEGNLYAVGEGSVWIDTKYGRMGLAGARLKSVARIDVPDGTPALGAPGSQELAGLPRVRIKTPGGTLTGKLIERNGATATVVTDGGARLTLDSKDVELTSDAPKTQVRAKQRP